MNAITPIDHRQPALPELSRALAGATKAPWSYTASDGSPIVVRPDHPTAATIAEAKRILPAYEAAMAPPLRATILQWLRGVAAACRPSPEPADVEAQATWMAQFSDLPATAYTRKSLAHIGNNAPRGFFPAPSVIRELVWPIVAEDVERLAALRRVAAAPMPQPQQPAQPAPARVEPTEAEREHVRRVVAQRQAELDAHAEQHRRPGQVRVTAVSDGALLAAYEAQVRAGGPAAAAAQTRANMLRAKIAKAAENIT